jgi:putative ABC transport system permease protein
MINEYFTIAVRNILHRKLRSWLTVIGIVLSITVIFVLISLSLGLNKSVDDQFEKLGADKIFIEPKGQLGAPGSGGAVELLERDGEAVKKVSGVKDVSYYPVGNAKVEFSDQIRYTFAIGVPLDRMDVLIETSFYVFEDGRMMSNGEEKGVVIGSQYKHNNYFDRPVELGDKLLINDIEFKVKGIIESIGSPPDDRTITMSIKDYREIFPDSGSMISVIIAKTEHGEDVNEVASKIERRLRSVRDVDEKNQDFRVSTPEELLSSFGSVLNILTGFLLGIGAISLLVGGIGIANTMYTSVIERTKEIGLMKAVGARNNDIMLIFMTEAGLIGAIGGIVGVVLGLGIAKLVEFVAISQLGEGFFQISTPFYLIIGCIFFAFIIGSVSGTLPARQAAKLKPVDALRYE